MHGDDRNARLVAEDRNNVERVRIQHRDLTQAGDSGNLQPLVAGAPPAPLVLLAGSTGDSTEWRLVEMWSDEGLPFDALLSWTGGSGGGQRAKVTVPGSARISIAARAIVQIQFTNQCDVPQKVRVAVATVGGVITCDNHLFISAVGGGLAMADPIEQLPPPYALYLRITPADPVAAAGTTVDLFDGLGFLVGKYTLSAQPSAGQPIIGIRKVVINPVPGVRYQVDYSLGV